MTMGIGEGIAAVAVLLLALNGCAGLIRQICLWMTRCPKCALCFRLAVPRKKAALAPLARCLQSRAVWDDPSGCKHTILLLPDHPTEGSEELETIWRQSPAVLPVTADQLCEMVQVLMQED